MSNVETYYLIDFENVNNAGLICSRHLVTTTIYIYFPRKMLLRSALRFCQTFIL